MNDIILIMASYLIIIFISFGILAFLQSGFLMPFLKVKTSRGKKILVKIRKSTGVDFVVAEEIEGQLVFKYFKETKRVNHYKSGVYRSYNINCINVDPETWAVVSTNFDAVSTNDPNKTDSLIERAMYRPVKKTTREMIILFLLVIIVIGVIFIAYKLTFLEQSIVALKSVGGANL